ncbi:conserved hypothetical protein [Neospora caninum Liverpool]|uniref:F-box domain-containing protein n=1 Tax=Neospora caninum (strain Liverpool) TaxID=572307 RepID=F0VNL0_NEOCL|nr:conserved hypothetical protein [Neospora caninum Liverpool]CBZ55306.1 conserved hypothetical protein [Neospora caninum Liverpool]CEL70038.1 TPA: hypothetical protein BN1204_057290 [Neospora caninum Liverpool]|eukprot:XP_003885334.1 conserved hypothetical protein [Neospora caninum Liverpool]
MLCFLLSCFAPLVFFGVDCSWKAEAAFSKNDAKGNAFPTMGVGSARPLVGSPEPGPGLLDLLEDGFHALFFRYFYLNELPSLRLVCKAFRRCLGPEQATASLRQMRGLVFPADWPARSLSEGPNTSDPSPRIKDRVNSVLSPGASPSASGPETEFASTELAEAPSSSSVEGTVDGLPGVATPRAFNLFGHFVSLQPPPPLLSELSLYWDQSVHSTEVMIPLFSKLLLVSESIHSLSVQTRTAAWSAPANLQGIVKTFPRVKRLRIHHSFLRRTGPNDTLYGNLVVPPGAYRRTPYLLRHRGEFERMLQPRPQLLSNCRFPACEDLEYYELCENELTPGLELMPFIRRRELCTIVHLLSVMAPVVRKATITLCCFKSLPFALQGILDSAAYGQTDMTTRDISASPSVHSSTFRAPENSKFPGSSLEELTVIQSLPERCVDDADVDDTELEAAFPGVHTAGHRGAPGESSRDRQFRKVLGSLATLRLVLQDDDMKDVFDSTVWPIVRHLCPAVRPLYEGTASLPLEIAGRALRLRLPSDHRPHLSKRGHASRRDQHGRDRYPERRVEPIEDASLEIERFDANLDGVSSGVVEMLRDWITRPEWMEVGVWKHIIERPPRLQFVCSWWHADVVAACAEALGFLKNAERSAASENQPCREASSSSRGAAGGQGRVEGDAGTQASEEESASVLPRTGSSRTFVLPTVAVKRMMWDYDARPFEGLIASLPHFVLAVDSHSATPHFRRGGPLPNLLGLQIDLCHWGKIRLCRQHIHVAKTHALQTRFLRLLDSNRLEYKLIDSATKQSVDAYIQDLLKACPHTEVIEYRRLSLEYTWQMETGVSGDTPPFSVEKLCNQGFHVVKTMHIPSCGGNHLPSSFNSSIISILFVRRKKSAFATAQSSAL